MDFKFTKKDKLKSKKQIEHLFENGQSIMAYPLLLKYMEREFQDSVITKTAVSVSKKKFNKAVDRIKIKRLIREVYRLNKPIYFNNLTTQYALMILYIGDEKPIYANLNDSMKELLEKFNRKTSKQ
jgi:ribonuclease P protein component